MGCASFTFVGAAVRVFGRVEVTKVLELVIFLHMTKNGLALPVCCFEFAVLGALFGDLDFSVPFV